MKKSKGQNKASKANKKIEEKPQLKPQQIVDTQTEASENSLAQSRVLDDVQSTMERRKRKMSQYRNQLDTLIQIMSKESIFEKEFIEKKMAKFILRLKDQQIDFKLQQKTKQLQKFINDDRLRNSWINKQMNDKIRQQVTKSMTYLMKELREREKNRKGMKIFSENSQLKIHCNLPNLRQPIFFESCVIQLETLYNTMERYFKRLECTRKQIVEKVDVMFNQLYKCVQYVFLNPFDAERKIQKVEFLQEFDFLIFSKLKYIQNHYDTLYKQTQGQNYTGYIKRPHHDPIHIGGLQCTSARFVRYIILAMLYNDQFLMKKIKAEKLSFVKDAQCAKKFIIQCQKYILDKRSFIEAYEKNTPQIREQPTVRNIKKLYAKFINTKTQKQMKQFRYQAVYDDFLDLVPEQKSLEYYQTSKSVWKYTWQKAITRARGGSCVARSGFLFDKQNVKQLHERRFNLKGTIPKDQNTPLNLNLLLSDSLEAKQFREQIFLQNQRDKKKIQTIKNEINHYHFFHHSFTTDQYGELKSVLNNQQGLIINANCGIFEITTFEKDKGQRILQKIKHVFNIQTNIQTRTIIVMKGNFDYEEDTTLSLETLNQIPKLLGRFQLRIGKYSQQKALSLQKKSSKNQKSQSYHRILSKQPVADDDFQMEMEYQQQTQQQTYAIYYSNQLKFSITQYGDVKVENVEGQEGVKQARKQFQQLKRIIHKFLFKQNYSTNEKIKIRDELEKEQAQYTSKYMKMSILTTPNNFTIPYFLWPKTDEQEYKYYKQNKYSLTQRQTWTYLKQQYYAKKWSKKVNLDERRSLKVLTWNICGDDRYKVNYIGYEKGSIQEKQIQQLQRNRIQTILKTISQTKADIICLQEAYYLFIKYQKQLKELLFDKAPPGQQYFFPEYNSNDGTQHPTNINDRTIIISKFPTKYYKLVCEMYEPTQNIEKDEQQSQLKKGNKAMILSELYINIKPKNPQNNSQIYLNQKNQQNKPKNKITQNKNTSFSSKLNSQSKSESIDLKVLIGSVHLKAGSKSTRQQARRFQLSAIQALKYNSPKTYKPGFNNAFKQHYEKEAPEDFRMSILAGDFNTYEAPGYKLQDLPQNSIPRLLREQYKYQDAEDSSPKKDWTLMKDGKPSVPDKILYRLESKRLKDRLKVIDVKPIGTDPLDQHVLLNPKKLRTHNAIITPSDHIGRLVQFAFLNNEESKLWEKERKQEQ